MREIYPKTILNPMKVYNSNVYRQYNMNIFRGCQHGCIYCDSRSECYGIDDFENVQVKINALTLIKKELSKKRKKGVICCGSMSDPYIPMEMNLGMFRSILEVISAKGYGIHIITKSDKIVRDIDIFRKMKFVYVLVTLTTVFDELAKMVEPNAPLPSERLKAIKALSENGINVGVTLMPVLPFIQDSEENIRNIVNASYSMGARDICPAFGVTLRDRQKAYFYSKLEKMFPGLKEKYISTYGDSYQCYSKNNLQMWNVLKYETRKRKMRIMRGLYDVEFPRYENESNQMKLF